jgi:hypothetical protein
MIQEADMTWEQIVSGTLKNYKSSESEREYAKGYRAGFKKGATARSPAPAVVRTYRQRPVAQPLVHDINRLRDIVEKIMSYWDHLNPHQKHYVENAVSFLRSNSCLPLKVYDELMSISRSMWDIAY